MNGGHAQMRDQPAVDQAGNEGRRRRRPRMPHSIARNGRQTRAHRSAIIGRMGGDHRGQAHHEAEREIDAGRDDDESLAEREQQRRGREDADRLQIVDVEDEARAIGDRAQTSKNTIRMMRKSQARSSAIRISRVVATALPWGGGDGHSACSDWRDARLHAEPAALARRGRPGWSFKSASVTSSCRGSAIPWDRRYWRRS